MLVAILCARSLRMRGQERGGVLRMWTGAVAVHVHGQRRTVGRAMSDTADTSEI